MTETVEYGLCFIAAAAVCVAEGLFLLALFFGGLAVRAIWTKIMLTFPEKGNHAHG